MTRRQIATLSLAHEAREGNAPTMETEVPLGFVFLELSPEQKTEVDGITEVQFEYVRWDPMSDSSTPLHESIMGDLRQTHEHPDTRAETSA